MEKVRRTLVSFQEKGETRGTMDVRPLAFFLSKTRTTDSEKERIYIYFPERKSKNVTVGGKEWHIILH